MSVGGGAGLQRRQQQPPCPDAHLPASLLCLQQNNNKSTPVSAWQVVRCFEDADVIHVAGKVDPVEDTDVINFELALADITQIEKRQERLKKTKGGWVGGCVWELCLSAVWVWSGSVSATPRRGGGSHVHYVLCCSSRTPCAVRRRPDTWFLSSVSTCPGPPPSFLSYCCCLQASLGRRPSRMGWRQRPSPPFQLPSALRPLTSPLLSSLLLLPAGKSGEEAKKNEVEAAALERIMAALEANKPARSVALNEEEAELGEWVPHACCACCVCCAWVACCVCWVALNEEEAELGGWKAVPDVHAVLCCAACRLSQPRNSAA